MLLLYALNLFLRPQTKPEGEYQDGVPNSAGLTVHFLYVISDDVKILSWLESLKLVLCP